VSIASSIPRPVGKLRVAAGVGILVVLHLAAAVGLYWTEDEPVSQMAFVLAWLTLNFFWLAVLRRPAAAAGLSLLVVVVIGLLSRFKFSALSMTVSFIDVMMVDPDTVSYLFATWPDLTQQVATAAAVVVPALILIWFLDPLRVRFRIAAAGLVLSFIGLAGLSFAFALDREDEWYDHAYLSKFARSGAVALIDLMSRGILESDAKAADRLDLAAAPECTPAARLPNIIMLLDESSFDITALPGIRVLPSNYRERFRSFDGKQRQFLVEGAGGPTWFTEYNVLAGLSVRSYGHFADGVTRIAAGHVERGLPHALRRCGYKTYSLYTALGAFVSARSFQTSAGIEHFYDSKDIGTQFRRCDSFYYEFANPLLTWERGPNPMFILIYNTLNHPPWNFRWPADFSPEWQNIGNRADVDEYLRRQELSARDYQDLLARLKRDYPGEPFLVVRFGDHQPAFAKYLVDPALDQAGVAQNIQRSDPRYFTTYYTFDTINFTPVDLSSALDVLDAPYLPVAVMDAAGVPLDPSFAEQKKIMQRCRGLFYLCDNGAEAKRFNRLLIDAGLIKGL
jgi:Sulfatase